MCSWKTTKAFLCLKIWPNLLCAYDVFKFKTPKNKKLKKKVINGYVFMNKQAVLRSILLKFYSENPQFFVMCLIIDMLKFFMCLFTYLNCQTWTSKPLKSLFLFSSLYVLCAYVLKIKGFMCLLGHVFIKSFFIQL